MQMSHKPTILLVDDDWSARGFLGTVLTRAMNALVIEADDPQSALTKAAEMETDFDLLITDIDLSSDRTGIDVAHEVTEHHPTTKVVLMSAADAPQPEFPAEWQFLA